MTETEDDNEWKTKVSVNTGISTMLTGLVRYAATRASLILASRLASLRVVCLVG